MSGSFCEKPIGSVLIGLWTMWLLFILLMPQQARATVAQSTPGGRVELRSTLDQGLTVTTTSIKEVNKKFYVYFCASESGKNEKCFYGPSQLFGDFGQGQRLAKIDYNLRPRIYNDKGFIKIGAGRYFYPVEKIYPQ